MFNAFRENKILAKISEFTVYLNDTLIYFTYTDVCENKHYHFVDQFDLCYKLYRDRKTWSSARDACKREGGDLIIFKNNEEKNFFDVLARGIYGNDNILVYSQT